MADKRAYAKFDVGYLDNPKVGPLLEDERPYAVLLHAASILYAAQHLTDGVVRVKTLLRKVGATQDDVDALVAAGLWVDNSDGTVTIHDYLEHNRAASDVKRAQAAGARGARARWGKPDADSGPPDDADPYADRIADRIGGSDANPNSQREREKEREEDSSSDADASDGGPYTEDVTRLCDTLAQLVRDNGHKAKVGKAWLDACDRLMRLDGYTPEQVEWIARWATADEFWAANIRSMPTLREKFSVLKARALSERNTRPGGKGKPLGKAIRRTDNGITLDQW
jgi:hypothetical protein